jgi:UDPglucose 6-dehydrogenase
MHISVIGTGYVGLVTGACFSEFGVNVTCMDSDATRIARLEKGDIPFYEPGITELIAKGIRENRISFTTDVAKAVDKALVIFIAVGTPPRPDGSADLSYVEEVGRGIARTMTGYKVIVTKSTVPVGTGEKMREVINAHQSGKFRFDIVSNPEFLREGSAIEDFMRPNRVVIGADSEPPMPSSPLKFRSLMKLRQSVNGSAPMCRWWRKGWGLITGLDRSFSTRDRGSVDRVFRKILPPLYRRGNESASPCKSPVPPPSLTSSNASG